MKIYGAHRKKSGSSVQRIHTCCLQRAHGIYITSVMIETSRLCHPIILKPLFHSNTVTTSLTRRPIVCLKLIVHMCKFLVLLCNTSLDTIRSRDSTPVVNLKPWILWRVVSPALIIPFRLRPRIAFPRPAFCYIER